MIVPLKIFFFFISQISKMMMNSNYMIITDNLKKINFVLVSKCKNVNS